MSYFTHLECSVPCGAGPYDPRVEQHLCTCGAPLLARYDLAAARAWKPETLRERAANMWRYRELLPLLDGEEPLTLGEGWTPLIHARRLGDELVSQARTLTTPESPTVRMPLAGTRASLSVGCAPLVV